jgi:hypothetical protein
MLALSMIANADRTGWDSLSVEVRITTSYFSRGVALVCSMRHGRAIRTCTSRVLLSLVNIGRSASLATVELALRAHAGVRPFSRPGVALQAGTDFCNPH